MRCCEWNRSCQTEALCCEWNRSWVKPRLCAVNGTDPGSIVGMNQTDGPMSHRQLIKQMTLPNVLPAIVVLWEYRCHRTRAWLTFPSCSRERRESRWCQGISRMMQLHGLESCVCTSYTVKWRWRVSILLSATVGETRVLDPVSEEQVRPK